MSTIGIILAGGVGSRMKMDTPKQYIDIAGRELISYSISAFREAPSIDDFIVVVDSEASRELVAEKYDVKTVLGGSSRNESFRNALDYISEKHSDCTKVVVNEAARPLITVRVIEDYVRLLDDNSCVYCIKPVTDSLETSNGQYVDRSNYRLVMSPEGYDFRVIEKYFRSDSATTFPGHTIPDGYSKYGYREYTDNIKVTYASDMKVVEELLKQKMN